MSLNWMKLVTQGRAKGIGQPWDEHENASLVAISDATNFPFAEIAPYIREHGALTVDEFNALRGEDAKEGKPNAHKSRKELEAKATALGVEFLPEIPDTDLRKLIEKAEAEAEAAADAPSRKELEAKATALGVAFTASTKDSTLAKKIAEAEAADNGN